MAVATLVGLEDQATVHALGNAGTQSAGLWQFLETGAMTKHLHAGRASEAGVLAADLARLGFTGPPAILEGAQGFFAAACPDADPAAVVRDPGGLWQLRTTSIKPWPSCRHTHPALDAAQALRDHVDPRRIERIVVETYQAGLDVCDRSDPHSEYAAKFSLQHCVAAALSRERVDFSAFAAEARADLAGLRARVELRLAEPYAAAYPEAWGSAVTIITKDGNILSERRNHARGDPEAPLGREEIIAKAAMLMAYGGVRDSGRLINAILALVDDGSLPSLALVDSGEY